ncbi:MAG: VIT1/CCC1 family protein [Candidatus Nitrosocaldus sp.]|nr:VIT1/CCC1 family protein [Candidatus Nitrosocaldus sp.]MDW8276276.1 VIT1/CCC1 family protein [Candidatus Nitrosocaldus sp.]
MSRDRLVEVAVEACRDEYADYYIYSALASSSLTHAALKGRLALMAEQEYRHYEFWRRYADGVVVKEPRARLLVMKLLALIMGITFVVKMLERHENRVIEGYKELLHVVEDEDKRMLEGIIGDEEEHESSLVENINEGRVRYLGFTVLGLSDALIEIAGIHAGTLGVYTDTFKAGLAGLIAGVAASIAMASAAYNQAKQTEGVRASSAATYTGIAYVVTALLLALPYFLVHDVLEALIISLLISIAILAYIALYSHVLFNRNFFRELGETTGIIFGATLALYAFGEFIRIYFNLQLD